MWGRFIYKRVETTLPFPSASDILTHHQNFRKRRTSYMAEKKEYRIKVQGQLIPVTEEVYLTYYRMNRRERHLEEKDRARGVFSYHALDTAEINGEDVIPDLTSPRVEDVTVDKLLAEKLHQCLTELTREEQELIYALFFRAISERQYAEMTGIPQKTINDRRHRILVKLKKLMKI
jgi:RNA polymerase sigma factor (sigma-70 family)